MCVAGRRGCVFITPLTAPTVSKAQEVSDRITEPKATWSWNDTVTFQNLQCHFKIIVLCIIL